MHTQTMTTDELTTLLNSSLISDLTLWLTSETNGTFRLSQDTIRVNVRLLESLMHETSIRGRILHSLRHA